MPSIRSSGNSKRPADRSCLFQYIHVLISIRAVACLLSLGEEDRQVAGLSVGNI